MAGDYGNPGGGNPGESMDDLYDAPEGSGKEEGKESIDQESMEHPTALIPTTLFEGKKFEEGDEIVLKIVKIHGDEAQVQYAPEKKGEEENSAASELDHMDHEDMMAHEPKPQMSNY